METVKRHPIRGFLYGIPLGLGLMMIVVGQGWAALGTWPPFVVFIVGVVIATLWSTFGPAKKPKGEPPREQLSTSTPRSEPAPAPTAIPEPEPMPMAEPSGVAVAQAVDDAAGEALEPERTAGDDGPDDASDEEQSDSSPDA